MREFLRRTLIVLWWTTKISLLIVALALCLKCVNRLMNTDTITRYSEAETVTFPLPLLAFCRTPFWIGTEELVDYGFDRVIFGILTRGNIPSWNKQAEESLMTLNRTFRELMTDIVRDNVQIARGELGTNTMDLLKEIGHNFHTFFNDENMSGNWSTYAYEGPLEERGAMQLCSTLERKKEVPNNVRVRFGLKEMIENYTTLVIKVVPPDSAIHLFQEGDSSARIWTVNPGHFFTVSVDVEEFQFLNTRTTPCESDPSYSYHQCITRCVTDQWMDPKTWSNLEREKGKHEELHYPCQIFGFDQDPKLPPCKSIDHELYAMKFFLTSGIYNNVRNGGCLQRCLKPCRRLKYTFHQEKTAGYMSFPTVYSTYIYARRYMHRRETNFAPGSAMLEIRSVQSLRPVFKEVWNYEFGQMVAEIGGNLGMFLGFSFLGSVGWILQDKLRRMVG